MKEPMTQSGRCSSTPKYVINHNLDTGERRLYEGIGPLKYGVLRDGEHVSIDNLPNFDHWSYRQCQSCLTVYHKHARQHRPHDIKGHFCSSKCVDDFVQKNSISTTTTPDPNIPQDTSQNTKQDTSQKAEVIGIQAMDPGHIVVTRCGFCSNRFNLNGPAVQRQWSRVFCSSFCLAQFERRDEPLCKHGGL